MRHYVAFYDNGERNWWDIFTRAGFTHCAAWRQETESEALAVDFDGTGLHVCRYQKSESDMRDAVLADPRCSCIIEIWIEHDERTEYAARGILNCVSVVKAFLGMPGSLSLTPFSLCRTLLRCGGTIYIAENLSGRSTETEKESRPRTGTG